MKKPIKPYPPTAPEKPEKIIYGTTQGTINLYSSQTLEDVVKSVTEYCKNWQLQYEIVFASAKYKCGYESDSYGSGSSGSFEFDIKTTETLSEEKYNTKLKQYNVKYELYKEKLDNYNKSLEIYNKDWATYITWQKKETENKERALLEKLQKKYK